VCTNEAMDLDAVACGAPTAVVASLPNHCSFSVTCPAKLGNRSGGRTSESSTTLHKATRGLRRPPAATTQKCNTTAKYQPRELLRQNAQ